MKFLALLLLITTNVYAGDMYLFCEHVDGETWHDAYIMDGPATVEFNDEDMFGGKYKFTITATMGEINTYNISKKYLGEGYDSSMSYTAITNKWSNQIPISKNFSCSLRD